MDDAPGQLLQVNKALGQLLQVNKALGQLLQVREAPFLPWGRRGHLHSPPSPAAGAQQAGAGSLAREPAVAVPVS